MTQYLKVRATGFVIGFNEELAADDKFDVIEVAPGENPHGDEFLTPAEIEAKATSKKPEPKKTPA